MRATLLTLIALLSITASNAQKFMDGRVLSVFNETYNNLPATKTIIVDSLNWDEVKLNIPIGFNYYFMKTIFTNIVIDPDNNSGTIISSSINGTPSLFGAFVSPRNRNTTVTPKPNSSASHLIETVAGKKIAKVEWNNIGLWEDTTNNYFMNFQYWMYEKDSALEMRFGTHNIDSSIIEDLFSEAFGSLVLVMAKDVDYNTGNLDKLYSITGLYPTKVDSFTALQVATTGITGLNKVPDSSTVIRIAYPIATTYPDAINTTNLTENININTNLSNGTLSVNFNENGTAYTCNLIGLNGNVVLNKKCTSNNNTFDVSNLPNGNYIILLQSNNHKVAYQFSK